MESRPHAATIPLEPHWIFSHGIMTHACSHNPLVVSIHGCISIDFAIKNSATREPLDGGNFHPLNFPYYIHFKQLQEFSIMQPQLP